MKFYGTNGNRFLERIDQALEPRIFLGAYKLFMDGVMILLVKETQYTPRSSLRYIRLETKSSRIS